MPVIFILHRTRESTEYTVLTHIGVTVWDKTKTNNREVLHANGYG